MRQSSRTTRTTKTRLNAVSSGRITRSRAQAASRATSGLSATPLDVASDDEADDDEVGGLIEPDELNDSSYMTGSHFDDSVLADTSNDSQLDTSADSSGLYHSGTAVFPANR